MIVYRRDLFDAAGLKAPNTFANIAAAIEKLHNPPSVYGFVAATKVDEVYMMQVLEHTLLANGYSPVGDASQQKLKETLEAAKASCTGSSRGNCISPARRR